MVGYDEQNTVLLPPREPGSLLPKQLLDHYERLNSTNQDSETHPSFMEGVQPLPSDQPVTTSRTSLSTHHVIAEQSNEIDDPLSPKKSDQRDTEVPKTEDKGQETLFNFWGVIA